VKVLVVGYGNPLRGDDGAGPWVADRLAALGLPGVETRTYHQLPLELAADLDGYDAAVFVDASVEGDDVTLLSEPELPSARSLSHHTAAGELAALSRRLGRGPGTVLLCTVRGEDFTYRPSLSPAALARAEEALRRIVERVGRNGHA
jgi:hydrogenase maturation protease